MSSSCPPQLHLTLPTNTTSFKRSFEQFGFDLESPVGGNDAAGSGLNDGNDRNKRARSASSFSDGDESAGSSRSSTVASGSSDTSISGNDEGDSGGMSGLSSATHLLPSVGTAQLSLSITHSSLAPPRLPTPEIQDVEMPDYPLVEESDPESAAPPAIPSSTSENDEHYRVSLERFNAFDSQISALRRSRSPTLTRSPTPPPTLPPLALSEDESHLQTTTIPFLHPPAQPSPPLPESFYSFGIPLSSRSRGSARSAGRTVPRDDPRVPPHETHGTAENSTNHRDSSRPATGVFAGPSRVSTSEISRELLNEAIPISTDHPFWEREPIWESDSEDDSPRRFRETLDTALEILRSPSPILREVDDSPRPLLSRAHPNPPTLPPILTEDHDGFEDGLERLMPFPEPDFGHPSHWEPEMTEHPTTMGSDRAQRHPSRISPYTHHLNRLGRYMETQTDAPVVSPPRPPPHSTPGVHAAARSRDALGRPTRWPSAWRSTSSPEIPSEDNHELRVDNPPRNPTEASERYLRQGLLDPREMPPGFVLVERDTPQVLDTNRLASEHIQRERHVATASSSGSGGRRPPWADLTRMTGDDSRESSRLRHPTSLRRPRDTSTQHNPHPPWLPVPNLDDTALETESASSSGTQTRASSVTPSSLGLSSHYRLRNRVQGTQTRASNSLVAENASEMRRRNSRRELLERLSRDDLGEESPNLQQTSRPPFPARSHLFAPQLPPLQPRRRSSSPPPQPHRHASDSDPYGFSTRDAADLDDGSSSADDVPSYFSRLLPTLDRHPAFADPFTEDLSRPASPVRRGGPSLDRSHRRSFSWGTTSSGVPSEESNTRDDGQPYPSTAGRGIFDSRSSTISDMAHTIAHNADQRRHDSISSRNGGPLIASEGGDRTRSDWWPDSRHYTGAPYLPSPDLGGLFDTNAQPFEFEASRLTNEPPVSRPTIRAPRISTFSGNTSAYPRPRGEGDQGSRPRVSPSIASSQDAPNASPSSSTGTYRHMDPNSFAPGPFRNTVQRLVDMERLRDNLGQALSRPPLIPPLNFENDFSDLISEQPEYPEGLHNRFIPRRPLPQSPVAAHQQSHQPHIHTSSSTTDANGSSGSDRYRRRPSLYSGAPPSRRTRPADDLHSYLTRQTRIEASRLDEPGSTQSPSESQPPNSGNIEGFSRAIEVLRHDGLSQTRSHQLINHFHREQMEAEARHDLSSSFSSSWGDFGTLSGPRSSLGGPRRYQGEPWLAGNRGYPAGYISRARPAPSRSPTQDIEYAHERLAARLRARYGQFPSRPGGGDLRAGRTRALGDYMRDEDFDESYESLISLAATLGEVKPRATPNEVISGLESATYKDWMTSGCDTRCPICLDDYEPSDPVLKLPDCSHWLHKGCLEKWLGGANTCPVCRKNVQSQRPQCPYHDYPGSSSRRRDDPGSGGGSGGGRGVFGGGGTGGPWMERDWPPPWRYGQDPSREGR